jgi:hypothetical protein
MSQNDHGISRDHDEVVFVGYFIMFVERVEVRLDSNISFSSCMAPAVWIEK